LLQSSRSLFLAYWLHLSFRLLYFRRCDDLRRELPRGSRYFVAERVELLRNLLIMRVPLAIEDAPGLRDWNDERHSPAAQGAHDELHSVDGLQALCASGSANQTYNFISQISRLAVT